MFVLGSGRRAQSPPVANATLTATGPGAYALTLNNTGSTTIGTMWYSWIPGEDFMGSAPTNVLSPTGWTDAITHSGSSDGYAIQWTATSSASDLAAGNSLLGFSFDTRANVGSVDDRRLAVLSDHARRHLRDVHRCSLLFVGRYVRGKRRA